MGESRILIERFIGRNGFDPPHDIHKDQCVEALNGDWYGASLFRKRGGSTALSTTGGTAFTGPLNTLIRHVPTADDTAAELWGIDNAGTPVVKRLAAGTAWADVSLDDAITSRPQDIAAATFNGKLFLCYGAGTATATDTTAAATAGTNYVVGAGVTVITVKGWGAAGGADGGDGATGGGGGGFAQADIPVTPGETLSKRVGGGGARSASSFQGGGGGGYTGLFRGTTPLLIAPGGGGGAKDGAGGAGGGAVGVAGSGVGGSFGTQAAGGAAGGATGNQSIEYLIAAGAGGGGSGVSFDNNSEGGGGAGGDVLTGTDAIAMGQSLAIVIGAGGAGSTTSADGVSGGNSTFNGHTAVGGGGGGTQGTNGAAGGSGGGAASIGSSPGGVTGVGYSGGSGTFINGGDHAAGGGGGAGAAGADASGSGPSVGGGGGAGQQSSISGSAIYYGAGGGGAASGATAGAGGTGGGGAGASGIGNGADGTGISAGGGGGSQGGNGGAGTAGRVIVRYLTASGLQATGGTITTSGSYTIHTFTANGNFILSAAATAGASLAGGNGGGWLSGGSAAAAGGTNGGGAGGAHGTAAAFRSGGGGGAGYFGGGGGSADRANAGTGGGGGGSSFISGTNSQTVAGSGINPGNTSDPNYGGGAGLGSTTAAGADGRLVIIATSATDRLHVYDSTLATPRVRRVGLAITAAPTVANTGGGAYAAVLRYYRQRTIQLDALTSTRVMRRSEPSSSVSFTPSGAGTAARVTRAAFPGEGETHWELEASTDNITFYRIATTVIGTTTYDDSAATTTYSGNAVSDPIGMYALPTSVRGIIATASRLLIAGAYASGGKNNRVWWTPVLGSSDQGDDERIPTNLVSYTDLSENAGDTFVGFAGPINGVVYVFMQREIWRLIPTGDPNAPFISRQISDLVGAIHQKAICLGEDEAGNPCIYFVSYDGIYRIALIGQQSYGSGGAIIQYIGRDVEDRWYGLNGQNAVNLTATNQIAHATWHRGKHQAWFWIATGNSADPDTILCFDPKLGQIIGREMRCGWSVFPTGLVQTARCSTVFSNTVGSTMSRDLKPYVGLSGSAVVLKGDTADTSDNGTAFQASITSGPLTRPAVQSGYFSVGNGVLQAKAQAATSIQMTLVRDYGLESRPFTASIAPSASEVRVTPQFEGSALSPAKVIQVTLGDASAVASAFTLDALTLPLEPGGSA